MADNEYMKTNILIVISLVFLVSCNEKDDSGLHSKPPVGTINKLWVPYTSNYQTAGVTSIDLSNPLNIVVTDATHTQVIERPSNGRPGRKVVTVSDCVFSGTQVPDAIGLGGKFDVTLTTGNPVVCNQFMPMHYSHYGYEENSDERLSIVKGWFQ